MALSEFDRATSVDAAGDGRFVGAVHPGWDIGGNANGGYLLALAAQGMRRATGRPDPVTLTAHYVSPAPAGPMEVVTETIKEGRRFATVTASLRQDGAERIRVLGAMGDVGAAGGGLAVVRDRPPVLPPPAECVARNGPNGEVPVPLGERLDVRLHPDDAGFATGKRSGAPVMRGWFAFSDGRPIDTLALLLACDAFPPTVFNMELAPGWVPTIELTVHVRGVPAPGPLACRFETRFVQNGCFEEDGDMWDSTGRLVAQSRQLALLPRGQ